MQELYKCRLGNTVPHQLKPKWLRIRNSHINYGEVHTYLSSGEYSPDCDKNYKRSLGRKAANFKVEEGRLYYIGNQEKRPGVKQRTDVRRIVVESEEEQRRIIRLIFDKAILVRE